MQTGPLRPTLLLWFTACSTASNVAKFAAVFASASSAARVWPTVRPMPWTTVPMITSSIGAVSSTGPATPSSITSLPMRTQKFGEENRPRASLISSGVWRKRSSQSKWSAIFRACSVVGSIAQRAQLLRQAEDLLLADRRRARRSAPQRIDSCPARFANRQTASTPGPHSPRQASVARRQGRRGRAWASATRLRTWPRRDTPSNPRPNRPRWRSAGATAAAAVLTCARSSWASVSVSGRNCGCEPASVASGGTGTARGCPRTIE